MSNANVSTSLFRFRDHAPSYTPTTKPPVIKQQARKIPPVGIMSSSDYGKFELLAFNRDVKKIRFLEASMKKHGWISAYPMHVVFDRASGTYKIKAGHHRFVTAKKLGIPVKFVVCDDTATIYELEKATSRWTAQDYLISNVRQGKSSYIAVDEYVKKTGVPLTLAVSLLGGEGAGSHNKHAIFKLGEFELGDTSLANRLGDLVIHMRSCGIEFATHNLLVQAISKALLVKKFSTERFKNKVSVHAPSFKKKDTVDGFLDAIEDIYNRSCSAKIKIPLAFLAKEASVKQMPERFQK